jgi:hypothetical protein
VYSHVFAEQRTTERIQNRREFIITIENASADLFWFTESVTLDDMDLRTRKRQKVMAKKSGLPDHAKVIITNAVTREGESRAQIYGY